MPIFRLTRIPAQHDQPFTAPDSGLCIKAKEENRRSSYGCQRDNGWAFKNKIVGPNLPTGIKKWYDLICLRVD